MNKKPSEIKQSALDYKRRIKEKDAKTVRSFKKGWMIIGTGGLLLGMFTLWFKIQESSLRWDMEVFCNTFLPGVKAANMVEASGTKEIHIQDLPKSHESLFSRTRLIYYKVLFNPVKMKRTYFICDTELSRGSVIQLKYLERPHL